MSESTLLAFSDALASAAERALESVVTVWAAPNRPISGTVLENGLVLTVEHVLGQDSVRVQREEDNFEGAAVGRDPGSDLAALRVEGLKVSPMRLGAAPRLGSVVLAIARPANAPRVSGGVVSGHGMGGRRGAGGEWLLTDVRPFPGVSGGALVDGTGAFVGLINAGVSRGEMVAVPAARALEVARTLAERGSLPRGYLGVATQTVRLPDGETGLIVLNVEAGSPAEAGGVLMGDVLHRWNDEPLEGGEALLARVTGAAGQNVRLGVLRGGAPLELHLIPSER